MGTQVSSFADEYDAGQAAAAAVASSSGDRPSVLRVVFGAGNEPLLPVELASPLLRRAMVDNTGAFLQEELDAFERVYAELLGTPSAASYSSVDPVTRHMESSVDMASPIHSSSSCPGARATNSGTTYSYGDRDSNHNTQFNAPYHMSELPIVHGVNNYESAMNCSGYPALSVTDCTHCGCVPSTTGHHLSALSPHCTHSHSAQYSAGGASHGACSFDEHPHKPPPAPQRSKSEDNKSELHRTRLSPMWSRSLDEGAGHQQQDAPSRASGLWEEWFTRSTGLSADNRVDPSERNSKLFDTNDKLFLDLLDDLDRISGNTPSARRRRKARDLFSEWLFSQNLKSKNAKGQQGSKAPLSFNEFAAKRSQDNLFKDEQGRFSPDLGIGEGPVRLRRKPHLQGLRSTHGVPNADAVASLSPYLLKQLKSVPSIVSEDDADSGYHTGESTLRDHTPGELTLTREELRKNIDAFNDNQHGLIMTLHEETATFQGFIRVHMNLMRPISMSLPSRPTSIYDVVGSDCESDEPPCETLTTSFYLPKDTTKVIHISSATTTQDVIKALLQKFKITDNPRKFALYEKTENEGAKATMRRLLDEEKPLHLCLSWTAEGLESHRYILQENEPGEIVWEAFSIPELENFLKILDREEDEYVDQMKAKYKLLGIQIERQMKTLVAESEEESQSAACMAGPPGGSQTSFEGDSREPVYV